MREQQIVTESSFIDGIGELLEAARSSVVKQVNTTMLMTYFEIGRRIVEWEQMGASQADYGHTYSFACRNPFQDVLGKASQNEILN